MSSSSKETIVTPGTSTDTRFNTRSVTKSSESSSSIDDLMKTLQYFCSEFLTSIKSQSTIQAPQFKGLKNDIKQFSSLFANLKAENSKLTTFSISQVLHEISEKGKYANNAVVYGILKSSSSAIPQHINDEKLALHRFEAMNLAYYRHVIWISINGSKLVKLVYKFVTSMVFQKLFRIIKKIGSFLRIA